MTVKELIELLSTVDENLEIFYNHNEYGAEPVDDVTELKNGFETTIGIVII